MGVSVINKVKYNLLIFLASFGITLPTLSDTTDPNKYYHYLPSEILVLSEKEKLQIPASYIKAALYSQSETGLLMIGSNLNILMYSGIHDLKSSVKEFQSDLGETATGKLSVGQISELIIRSGLQRRSRFSFPYYYKAEKKKGYFNGEKIDGPALIAGNLVIAEGEVDSPFYKISSPINYIEVFCSRKNKTCELNGIQLDMPTMHSDFNYGIRQPFKITFDITNWGENSITATSVISGLGCLDKELDLNFDTRKFLVITKKSTSSCAASYGRNPERVASIEPGSDYINNIFTEYENQSYKVLSSAFRKKLEQLSKKSPNKAFNSPSAGTAKSAAP
jgi:hypothetical protein